MSTERPAAILLDIEGTTTPIDFVHKVLFPFARERIPEFVEGGLYPDILAQLQHEYALDTEPGKPPWDPAAYLIWLTDQDRKSTPLKAVQGVIWKQGYESGQLNSEVFPDVRPALERWTEKGTRVFIFSSGSVLAQQLLFRYSEQGDLTPYLGGYFDTTTGPKRIASSYQAIAKAIGVSPSQVLFISDVVEELEAADAAGLRVLLTVRPGNRPFGTCRFENVSSFDLHF